MIEKRLKIRRRKDVWLRAQNDGDGPGTIVLFADPGDSTLKLKYFQGSDEVTNLIAGSGLNIALAVGQEVTIRISVKAKPGQQDEDFFIDAEDLDTHMQTDSVGFHLDIKPFD